MTKKQKAKNNKITSAVMDKINSGKVKMRPHWYFGLLGFFSILITALLGLIAVYAGSIITLWLRVVSADGPALGIKNKIGELLLSFPWWSILLIILSVIILISIISRFGHLYKIRFIYLAPIALVLAIAFGYIASYTHLPNILNINNRTYNQCRVSDEDCSMGNRIYRKMRLMK